MGLWENDLWLRLFGTVWKTLVGYDKNIGAFAACELSDSEKEVMIDDNAIRLLGYKKQPDYDELISSVDRISDNMNYGSPITIHYIEAGEGVTAGFVHLTADANAAQLSSVYPMSTQAQLIDLISDAASHSLLALARLDGIDMPAFACAAINAVSAQLPEGSVLAAHTDLEFWIFVPGVWEERTALLSRVCKAVAECAVKDEYGVQLADSHSMTLTIGCGDPDGDPAMRMHTASFALYEAAAKGQGNICEFSHERYKLQKAEYINVKKFSELIDNNLFLYHFQPIVSARSGDIVAYEALMRTDKSIDMNPLQILDMARRFGRLYDIEKATLHNALTFLSKNQEVFEKRSLYVNAIPSHTLTEEDFEKLTDEFGELLEKIVIEFTEQTQISDEDLSFIHKRLKKNNVKLAIDDYGTGYSNTSNLLRYNPDVVKIDRALIAGIDTDYKMQKIVASIIEFLHASGFLALAEGVETAEELRTMINLSADYIQGYYISKPKPVLVHEVSKERRDEIVRINLEANGEIQKIYKACENEIIDTDILAFEKYTDLFIESSSVTLRSTSVIPLGLCITVKDGCECTLVINNVKIFASDDCPIMKLGSGSRVRLICEGSNSFDKRGILVPADSFLYVGGSGSLFINSEDVESFGIGAGASASHGDIVIDLTGELNIQCGGEKCVGIGGGKNILGSGVHILSGAVSVNCSGDICAAIGCINGGARIEISDCTLELKNFSATSVGIGSITGSADIDIKNYRISCSSSGSTLTSVGVCDGGMGHINMKDGQIRTELRGKYLNCVGTRGGEMGCNIDSSKAVFYCEGMSVSGIGDISGSGEVSICETDLNVTFLTGDGLAMGSPNGTLEISGGVRNIKINE